MISSFEDKSVGIDCRKNREEPNNTFTQLRKNIVGPNKYNRTINHKHSKGYKSKKNEKNKISAMNIIDPGKPKKTRRFIKLTKKSLGHKKFTPFISVTKRVLNLRPIPSTNKKELVDSNA
jgi:hypothetical protein